MRWSTLAIIGAVGLRAACAAATMRTYVGQDMRAELACGPPTNHTDLERGARAFQ